jgi:hypothetical protein
MSWGVLLWFFASSAAADPGPEILLRETNLYKIFEVNPAAADKEAAFKASYRKLMMRYHPDRNPGNPEAARVARRINSLLAELKKVNYQAQLVHVTPETPNPRAWPSAWQREWSRASPGPAASAPPTPAPRATPSPRPTPAPTPAPTPRPKPAGKPEQPSAAWDSADRPSARDQLMGIKAYHSCARLFSAARR